MTITVSKDRLESFVSEVFVRAGVPDDRAKVLASCLVEADLEGISSHGATRVPIYVKRILDGYTEVMEDVSIVENYPATAVVDGKNVIGQVASEFSMRLAIEKAKKVGFGCVSLRATNHAGTCAHYSMMAVKENMIGFTFMNTTPLAAVFGGTHKAVGNNPFSVAVPASRHYPVVLDMACAAAQGKIEILLKKGERVPEGWAVDEDGKPTTDPAKALKGVLLPIAGPKGSGIAIINDIICGILSGSGVGNEIRHLNDPAPQNLGCLFMALDISKFDDVEHFKNRVDDYVDYLKGTAVNDETILMPGEVGFLEKENRLQFGIPLPEKIVDDLNVTAEKLGMEDRL